MNDDYNNVSEAQKTLFENKIIWNIDDVCSFLGTTRNGVYAKVKRGQLPHRKVGKRLYFDPVKVLAVFK